MTEKSASGKLVEKWLTKTPSRVIGWQADGTLVPMTVGVDQMTPVIGAQNISFEGTVPSLIINTAGQIVWINAENYTDTTTGNVTTGRHGLMPKLSGNASQVFKGDGTWGTISGAGTVTSVAATVPSFLSVSGSPITSSGTLAISLSGVALPVASGGTNQTSFTDGQLLIGNSTGNTLTKATLTAGSGITITNGGGSITLSIASGAVTNAMLAGSIGTDKLSVSANVKSVLDAADFAGIRSALSLVPGTNVQAWGARLDTLSTGFGGILSGFLFWDSATQTYTKPLSIANSYLTGSGAFTLAGLAISLGDTVTASSLKTALSLNNVENTALSTWAGSSNILTVGVVTGGTWRGATVQPAYGGTGLTSFAVGDTIYCSLANTLAKLSGNTTTTQKWLTQTGDGTNSAAPSWSSALPVAIVVACSDETTDLTTGTAKVTFRMPHAMTLTSVRLNVNTAPTGSVIIVDVKEEGTTIFSTKPQIATSAKTSVGGAVPGTLSDTSLADDAEITINLDQIGSTIAGKGLKVTLIGTR